MDPTPLDPGNPLGLSPSTGVPVPVMPQVDPELLRTLYPNGLPRLVPTESLNPAATGLPDGQKTGPSLDTFNGPDIRDLIKLAGAPAPKEAARPLPQVIPAPLGSPAGSAAEALGRINGAGIPLNASPQLINSLNPNASALIKDTDSPDTQAYLATVAGQGAQGRQAPTLQQILSKPELREEWVAKGPGTLEGMTPQAIARRDRATATPVDAAHALSEQSKADTLKQRSDWEMQDTRNKVEYLRDFSKSNIMTKGRPPTETEMGDAAKTYDAAMKAAGVTVKAPAVNPSVPTQAPPLTGPEAGRAPQLPQGLEDRIKTSATSDAALEMLQKEYDPAFIQTNAPRIQQALQSQFPTEDLLKRATPGVFTRALASQLPVPASLFLTNFLSRGLAGGETRTARNSTFIRKLYGLER